MRITMVGTGYVGLVSGACFSEFGHDVVCVDKDASKIERLENGEIPIFEPGLDALVESNVAAGRLSFSTDLAKAVPGSEAIFIAVGTPSRRGDGHADLQYVYAAAEEIGSLLSGYAVVVNKSTVPVGTGAEVEALIKKVSPDLEFDVASNPEFLREGSAIEDFMRPDRVVVGTSSDRAREVLSRLYRPLSLRETKILFTERTTSELIKYAANSFLATKISFINEMADLCEAVGANVQEVAKGIGLDGRIGSKFLHAGPGYGGSCFPKDTLALLKTSEDYKVPLQIVSAVVDVNSNRKKALAQRVSAMLGGDVAGKTVAVLGLTFKPNTDDMRDSPSLDLIPALVDAGATVQACDPEGVEQARPMLPNITYCDDAYEALNGADIVVLLTEWNAYRALDLDRMKQLMTAPRMLDLRNVYPPEELRDAGFTYESIGRS
ncbi:MAG: UDP-glucose/GDP-mannose dehydrogenase family protein [Pseudomonadota bacterium]